MSPAGARTTLTFGHVVMFIAEMADNAQGPSVPDENTTDFSEKAAFILTELHEILGLVLKYLPAKSLNTCAR